MDEKKFESKEHQVMNSDPKVGNGSGLNWFARNLGYSNIDLLARENGFSNSHEMAQSHGFKNIDEYFLAPGYAGRMDIIRKT